MGALVICSHLPHEGHFESERFTVAPVRCDDDYSYWRGLEKHWDGPDTLLNVEHDVGVTDAHLAALTDCPHEACTWAYLCHWASTGLARSIFAQSVNGSPITEGDEWADRSGIGLVKIAASARVAPLRREQWPRVELAVADAVAGPFHLHWPPVTHHHF